MVEALRPSARLGYPRSRRLRKRRDFVRVQDSSARVTTNHFVLLVAKPIARDGAASGPKPQAPSEPFLTRDGAASGPKPQAPAEPVALAPCRLGVVASRKVGGAVARNRAKRLVREVFRQHPALFPDGVDLVVIARPGAPDQCFATVCSEIAGAGAALLRRAREVLRK